MKKGLLLPLVTALTWSAFAQEVAKASTNESLLVPSAEFKKPAVKAFRAISRIEFIEPTADDGYAERTLDAEKTLDDAKDAADTDSDKQIVKLLKTTLTMKGLGRQDVMKYGQTAMQCVNELYAIFDPDAQNEKMKEIARKRTCLADSKRLIDALNAEAEASLKGAGKK